MAKNFGAAPAENTDQNRLGDDDDARDAQPVDTRIKSLPL
jgi:hypothetical protein